MWLQIHREVYDSPLLVLQLFATYLIRIMTNKQNPSEIRRR